MTPAYRVIPIDLEVAAHVRHTGTAPRYGHPVHGAIAKGYGPCRSCLRQFAVGEERRLLFTHDSAGPGVELPQPGPVFIHEQECRPYDGDGFPPELLHLPLFLEGIGERGWQVIRRKVDGGDPDAAIHHLLAQPGIDFVNLRNAEAGCFIARIERVPASARPQS